MPVDRLFTYLSLLGVSASIVLSQEPKGLQGSVSVLYRERPDG